MKNLNQERFNHALEIRHWTAADLARASGVSASVISYYKRGKVIPKHDNLDKIAKALGTSSEWLMGDDVPMLDLNSSTITINGTEIKLPPEILEVVQKLVQLTDKNIIRVAAYTDAMLEQQFEKGSDTLNEAARKEESLSS